MSEGEAKRSHNSLNTTEWWQIELKCNETVVFKSKQKPDAVLERKCENISRNVLDNVSSYVNVDNRKDTRHLFYHEYFIKPQ